ncbi:MAG: efflux RND transporter permease subunit [Spirochaetaceae bacterium]|nr:MAG: efflux RND transporter permease subunit [Spirochaetaceae bacterium]
MKKIFEFFSKRHILASLFTIMVVLLGLNSLRTLRRDTFPTVDFGEVIIQTVYPGAAPEDVELNVTNKIEDELKNITGIKRISSTSLENVSTIDVVIESDVKDMEKVKRDIRDAVSRVGDLPDEVTEAPLILEIDTSLIPIMEVGITGELPYEEMRNIAEDFETKLKEVPGIARLEKQGYRAKEIKVEVDPAAMDRYQIPLREIIRAIQARNIRATGGTFESFTSEKNVVTLAQFRDPLEVGEVIVRTTFEGPSIKVKNLAVVREDFERESVISHMEGRKAISFVVYKSEEADIIRTVGAVKELIRQESGVGLIGGQTTIQVTEQSDRSIVDRIKKYLGVSRYEQDIFRYGPVRILVSNDLSRIVQNRFRITLTNGLIGLLLVMVMLSIFLNLRTAFWVAMGIPVAVLGVFFLMPLFGTFLDSISLTSLVLLIGIIVDDGIIISENIYRRREMGDSPVEAAVNGTNEVFFPVLTTILTTFLAFAPMFFMKGMMGKFVFVIPLTISLALFISLFEAAFALPSHLAYGMERSSRGAQRESVRKWFEALKTFYAKVAYHLLKVRYILVVLFIAALVLILIYAQRNLKFIMFPTKGADRFAVGVEMSTGTSLQATAEKIVELEGFIDNLPPEELDTFISRIGIGLSGGNGENFGFTLIGLTPFSERERTVDEIIEWLRPQIEAIEGVEKTTFIVDAGGPPVGKPISIRVTGNDNKLRQQATAEIMDYLATVDGVKDIDSNEKLGKEQIEIKINYDQLARLGLTVADVAQNVRIAYDGEVVTSLRDGNEDVNFRVQMQERARRDVNYLYNLSIPNIQNRLIKLREVARLEINPGPNAFYHHDGERTATIEADVDQDIVTPLEATTLLMTHYSDIEERWPGIRLSVGGEAEESQASIVELMTTFAIALVGIYFLLVLLFNSYTQPFLVLVSVPFGIIGVIIAFGLHGETLSFLGVMGIIGMVGVVVNDSLVLVNHLNNLRKWNPDWSIRKLVSEGTSHRLRAILLTTLTTVAGLLPLAYGLGGTDLYMQPMALALGYGILFATPLTLVLVPSLYMIGADIGRLLGRKKA